LGVWVAVGYYGFFFSFAALEKKNKILNEINSLFVQTGIWFCALCILAFIFCEGILYTVALLSNSQYSVNIKFIPVTLIICTIFAALVSKWISFFLLKTISYFREMIEAFYEVKSIKNNNIFYIKELIELKEFFMRAISLQKEKIEHEKAVSRVSRQIAHDIRTPLLALESMADDFEENNIERYRLLRKVSTRVRNIANSFLLSTRKEISVANNNQAQKRKELIFPLVEEVVFEKVAQYKKNIQK
jgi:signal transduction histidine kinase